LVILELLKSQACEEREESGLGELPSKPLARKDFTSLLTKEKKKQTDGRSGREKTLIKSLISLKGIC